VVRINNVVSTALASPLYPISVSYSAPINTTFITTQGYVVTMAATSDAATGTIPSFGDVLGASTASFAGAGCTGNIWLNAASYQPGQIVRAGTPALLYYIARNATTTVNPTRGSRNSTALAPCESPAATALGAGTYYPGFPINAATTGFGLSVSGNGVIVFDYVP
jgi:hypothetical protein